MADKLTGNIIKEFGKKEDYKYCAEIRWQESGALKNRAPGFLSLTGQGVDQGEILFDTCGEMDYNTLNKRADD